MEPVLIIQAPMNHKTSIKMRLALQLLVIFENRHFCIKPLFVPAGSHVSTLSGLEYEYNRNNVTFSQNHYVVTFKIYAKKFANDLELTSKLTVKPSC